MTMNVQLGLNSAGSRKHSKFQGQRIWLRPALAPRQKLHRAHCFMPFSYVLHLEARQDYVRAQLAGKSAVEHLGKENLNALLGPGTVRCGRAPPVWFGHPPHKENWCQPLSPWCQRLKSPKRPSPQPRMQAAQFAERDPA